MTMIMVSIMAVVVGSMGVVSVVGVAIFKYMVVLAVIMWCYTRCMSVVISRSMGMAIHMAMVMFFVMTVVVGSMDVVSMVGVAVFNAMIHQAGRPCCGGLHSGAPAVLAVDDNALEDGPGARGREAGLDADAVLLAGRGAGEAPGWRRHPEMGPRDGVCHPVIDLQGDGPAEDEP
jgi:hypothetical protein